MGQFVDAQDPAASSAWTWNLSFWFQQRSMSPSHMGPLTWRMTEQLVLSINSRPTFLHWPCPTLWLFWPVWWAARDSCSQWQWCCSSKHLLGLRCVILKEDPSRHLHFYTLFLKDNSRIFTFGSGLRDIPIVVLVVCFHGSVCFCFFWTQVNLNGPLGTCQMYL